MNRPMDQDRALAAGSGFVMGLAWGAVIGGAAALLLAPRPGSELRAKMSGSMNRLGRQAKNSYDRASETVTDLASRAASLAQDAAARTPNIISSMQSSSSATIRPS